MLMADDGEARRRGMTDLAAHKPIIDGSSHQLDQELATYEREKGNLLARAEGKYVLIKGDEVLGTFHCQRDAVDVGHRMLGNVPFLTKQIVRVELPIRFGGSLLGL